MHISLSLSIGALALIWLETSMLLCNGRDETSPPRVSIGVSQHYGGWLLNKTDQQEHI